MSEQLSYGFEAARLLMEDHLRAQMAKLVGCHHDAGAPFEIGRYEPGDRCLALHSPIGIYENTVGPVTDDLRGDAVAIFKQRLGDLRRDIEGQLDIVLHLARREL